MLRDGNSGQVMSIVSAGFQRMSCKLSPDRSGSDVMVVVRVDDDGVLGGRGIVGRETPGGRDVVDGVLSGGGIDVDGGIVVGGGIDVSVASRASVVGSMVDDGLVIVGKRVDDAVVVGLIVGTGVSR